MIEVELYTYLKEDASVSNIVGSHIYPLVMPQGIDMPSIVYTVVNSKDNVALGGQIIDTDTYIQLDCYTTSYSTLKALVSAVKNALYSFSYFPYDFHSRDIYEEDTKLYRQLIEFKIKI